MIHFRSVAIWLVVLGVFAIYSNAASLEKSNDVEEGGEEVQAFNGGAVDYGSDEKHGARFVRSNPNAAAEARRKAEEQKKAREAKEKKDREAKEKREREERARKEAQRQKELQLKAVRDGRRGGI